MRAALALGISLAAALGARGARAVSGSGALAAAAVGSVILWATGWPGGAVLAVFFLPSTLVGRLGARRPGASDARGEQRDEIQVLANGGAAALGACTELLVPGLGLWTLTGALAAASADTWATALGAFSRSAPRDLLSGRPMPRGSSGAVSVIGTLGGFAGALLLAATASLAGRDPGLLMAGSLIGVSGMLLDSLLGSSLQARFSCPVCAESSERRMHRCGAATQLVRGWRWLDNDAVNAVATLFGGLAAAAWFLLRG